MSITFTNNLQVPSELTALPNRFTRPGFGSLYGFDAAPTEAPDFVLTSATADATSGPAGDGNGIDYIFTFSEVSGATHYRTGYSLDGSTPFTMNPPDLPYPGTAEFPSAGIYSQKAAGALGLHYRFVRAANASGLGPWSVGIQYRGISIPTLTVGTPTGATLPLTWTNTNAVPSVDHVLEYATDAGFTTGTGSATITAGTTSYNFTMTTPGTTYYFRVRGTWTSIGPPSTVVYGNYSAAVSHLYPASGFTISILDTEANILARSSDADGTVAYGTDTECFYVFNGVSWFRYPEQQ